MAHGGDIYNNKVNMDFSVSLNPLMPQDILKEAVAASADKTGYYPDIDQSAVRKLIGRYDRVSEKKVYAGSGASELILAVVRAVKPERALLFEPCFNGYRYALNSLKDCRIEEYLLKKENGFIPDEEFLDLITTGTDIIFLTDPWNPSGKNIDKNILEGILQKTKKTGTKVILDQSFLLMSTNCRSYYDADKLTQKYDNLYIIRSFTKVFACPGVRVGYVISNESNLKLIRNQLPEWNLSVAAESILNVCLPKISDEAYLQKLDMFIKTQRGYLMEKLCDQDIEFFESDTVYLLIRSGTDLYDKLLKQGILIRDCSDFKGLGKGYFRIAVKTREENEKLIEAIGRNTDGY